MELATDEDWLIIDVGGDDAGAVALGRYAEALEQFKDSIEMYYVINQRRYLTNTADEVTKLMYEIEAAARMKHTAIVNNTNLGCETTLDIIEQSRSFAEETSKITGLPVIYTVYPEEIAEDVNKTDKFAAKIYVKPIWG